MKRHRHRLTGSGEPRNARIEENVDLLNDIVSQEDMPQTRRMVREISHKTDIQLRCYEISTMSF